MPKRSKNYKVRSHKRRRYDRIMEEIRKLREDFLDSSSSESEDDLNSVTNSERSTPSSEERPEPEQDQPVVTTARINEEVPDQVPEPNNSNSEYFNLLGINPTINTKSVAPLHEELVIRWGNYLEKGLTKDQREELEGKYPFFENCPLLTPPVLNEEISTCLDGKALRQDRFMLNIQSQTGHSLSALGSQINKILATENKTEMKEMLSTLADVSQLLCNIHHAITTHRKYNILPHLKYSSRKIIETSKTDEFLLGKNFFEEVKSNEALKKAGRELKGSFPTRPYPKTQTQPGGSGYKPPPSKTQPTAGPSQQRNHLNFHRSLPYTKKKHPYSQKRQENNHGRHPQTERRHPQTDRRR